MTARNRDGRRPSGPVPGAPVHPRGARRRRLETTAEKLRVGQLAVMVVCLLCAVVAAGAIQGRIDAADEIEQRTEPLSADAVDVYRALAEADATVAGEFLSGGDSASMRSTYENRIAEAATGLARAGTLTERDGLTANRIADIAAELPVYTGLVERARATSGTEAGVAALRQAASLMQSTILRRAESFQRTESERLDEQYERAGSVPRVAVAAGALCLLALIGAQALLARKTRRLLNPGLVAATAAVLGVALWWALAVSASGDHLEDSRRHSQSVSDALGQAQIAARQARASEVLALVTDEPDAYEPPYSARMQRLARADGTGGALGAARQFIRDENGRSQVTAAVDEARAWLRAHARIHELHKAGRDREAIALAVGPGAPAAAAFTAIEHRLAETVTNERQAFDADMSQAQDALSGLLPGTVALMLVAAAAAAWGVGRRLKEYR